jgi:hypothetical protein
LRRWRVRTTGFPSQSSISSAITAAATVPRAVAARTRR